MIQQGVFVNFSAVKVILSHASIILPYLAIRAAHLAADAQFSILPAGDVLNRKRTFYFDLMLSSNPSQLDLVLAFAKPDYVLYGSDFPYTLSKTIRTFVEALDVYKDKSDEEKKYSITRGGAL
ncbi:hypothetical protein S40288_10345 [Stachybotrys chartarum IBT 40288]|nr:hypothetical protein S40288_10345 [Stachybotrys chartarum IBT 40288]